jgi:hypothetical protein
MVLRSKEILISDNPKDMKNPVRILDGREIKAWSIDWQGRYLDYDKEKISDPKSEGFFKNTKIILPYISLASQAVKYENDFYFRHSIMSIICNINISLDIQCALINNIVNRYYYTLILRSSTLQGSKRSQFHPRIINNFIIQKNVENNPQILSRLEELSRDCHALAHDMAHGDRELSAWIEDKVSRKFRYFSTYSDTDLSTLSGVLNIEKAFFDKNGRLIEEGSLFHIGGNKNRLYYILQKSALEGKEKLTKKELEDFKIPEDPAVLKEINLKIADWLQRKPTLGEKLRANEREIDRLVLEACSDLTDKERETIIRRCREFPLSEVIQTPLPGKPTKKIKVKVYSDRFK